jgi:hypothetical protein
MAQRSLALLTTLTLTIIPAAQAAASGELMFGCWTRPACGKVCKLVCGTTKLTAECYGAECEQICVPGPSRQGCKHCASCCGDCTAEPCGCCNQCPPCTPECKFCWFEWCPPVCSQPRTVKRLVKFAAQKEICWYHWEVVDACDCDCEDACGPGCGCGCAYKPVPPDAQIGDTLEVSDQERAQVAAWLTTRQGAVRQAEANSTTTGALPQSAQSNTAAGDKAAQPLAKKLTGLFPRGDQP